MEYIPVIPIVTTISLLFLWGLFGEFGFCIWRTKFLEANKQKSPADWIIMYVKLLHYKNRFRLAGLFGLTYALKYKADKT